MAWRPSAWKHLAIAVLSDPSHAAARGLLGLVAYRGGWRSPEAVSAQIGSDEAYAAALGSYNARRARMADSAEAHWKLALWCEQQGLEPEATAHLTRVVHLEPGREAAWKHLGYRKQGRRWVTDEQLAAEKAEAAAQNDGRPALAAAPVPVARLDRGQDEGGRAGRGPGDRDRPAGACHRCG